MASQTETRVRIKPDFKMPEPPLFKVIYMNDDHTSMEFVISTLIDHFAYTEDTATNITAGIHEQGSAVVAVLPYEIAEQKGMEVTLEARSQGFPLQVKVQSEEN
jgi:ATP-dependent Clp protease adaptor protein ClpS